LQEKELRSCEDSFSMQAQKYSGTLPRFDTKVAQSLHI
jgi:hypothetical protein